MTNARETPLWVQIMTARELGPMERLFLLAVLWHQGRNGAAWAKQETYAADIGTTARHVRRLAESLEARGWLVAERAGKLVHYAVNIPAANRTSRSGMDGGESGPGGPVSDTQTGRPGPVIPDVQVRLSRTSRSGDIRTHKRTQSKNTYPPIVPQGDVDQLFAQFWEAYPRKKAKDAARKAFIKRKPSVELLAKMLAAIETQKGTLQWQRDNGQYIPHPATWLNQGRWQDEIDTSIGEQSNGQQREHNRDFTGQSSDVGVTIET